MAGERVHRRRHSVDSLYHATADHPGERASYSGATSSFAPQARPLWSPSLRTAHADSVLQGEWQRKSLDSRRMHSLEDELFSSSRLRDREDVDGAGLWYPSTSTSRFRHSGGRRSSDAFADVFNGTLNGPIAQPPHRSSNAVVRGRPPLPAHRKGGRDGHSQPWHHPPGGQVHAARWSASSSSSDGDMHRLGLSVGMLGGSLGGGIEDADDPPMTSWDVDALRAEYESLFREVHELKLRSEAIDSQFESTDVEARRSRSQLYNLTSLSQTLTVPTPLDPVPGLGDSRLMTSSHPPHKRNLSPARLLSPHGSRRPGFHEDTSHLQSSVLDWAAASGDVPDSEYPPLL